MSCGVESIDLEEYTFIIHGRMGQVVLRIPRKQAKGKERVGAGINNQLLR